MFIVGKIVSIMEAFALSANLSHPSILDKVSSNTSPIYNHEYFHECCSRLIGSGAYLAQLGEMARAVDRSIPLRNIMIETLHTQLPAVRAKLVQMPVKKGQLSPTYWDMYEAEISRYPELSQMVLLALPLEAHAVALAPPLSERETAAVEQGRVLNDAETTPALSPT